MTGVRRKRGGRPRKAMLPQTADAALCRLAEMRATDPARDAVADAVVARLLGRGNEPPTAQFRIAAAELLTPADYRRQHGADVYAEGVCTVRVGTNARDHFNPRVTACLDGMGRMWGEDEVRGRLAAAVSTLRRLRFPTDEVPSDKVVATFEIFRSQAELWELLLHGLDEPPATDATPTPAEIQAMDDTLPWLYAVADIRQRLCVMLRAQRRSWRVIARMCDGINHMGAQRLEARGVRAIVATLNSGLVPVKLRT